MCPVSCVSGHVLIPIGLNARDFSGVTTCSERLHAVMCKSGGSFIFGPGISINYLYVLT